MSNVDLVIRGGKIVSPEQIIDASIAIDAGRIVAIGHDDLMPSAREETARRRPAPAARRHRQPRALPRPRLPAQGNVEDRFGGRRLRRRDDRLRHAQHQPGHRHRGGAAHEAEGGRGLLCATSASTRCSATTRIDRLQDLLAEGATSFKAFVGNTFGNLPAPTDGALLEGFEILAPLGIRTVVHAENSSIMARRQARLEAAGRQDALGPSGGPPRGLPRSRRSAAC